MHTSPKRASRANPETVPYAERPYERRLSDSGRKIVSLDIDAALLDEVDRFRASGRHRRGIAIDALLRIALANPQALSMT